MVKYDPEWYRQKAIENQKRKREQEKARRNYQINRQRRDLEELEALKNQLLRDARAERRKIPGMVSNFCCVSVNTVDAKIQWRSQAMAKALREMFPQEKTLYTVSSVEKLIADYLEAGGQVLQMREGTLGCGDVLLYDEAGKRQAKSPPKIGNQNNGG